MVASGRWAEWRSGWLLVLTSCIGMMISVLHIYSVGVFIAPMQAELGWSRSVITGGLLFTAFTTVIFSPFIGKMIDRYGARRIAIPGVIAYTASFALLSVFNTSPTIWLGMWFIVACGALFLKPTIWTAAVASRFIESRGLAFALTLCGTGLTGAIVPYAVHTSIEWVGWRMTFVFMGGSAAAILLPLMLLFFREAEKLPEPEDTHEQAGGSSIWALFRSKRFVQLSIATLFVTLSLTMIVVNFVPIMRSMSLSTGEAAAIASVIGLTSIIGRLAGGFLVDRIDARIVAGIAFLSPTIACLLLVLAPDSTGALSSEMAVAVAVLVGLSAGAEIEVIAYLTTRYFGLANFGVVFGTIVAFFGLGTGVGPSLGSAVFDATGSYQYAIMGIIPLYILATFLIVTLGRYPALPGKAH